CVDLFAVDVEGGICVAGAFDLSECEVESWLVAGDEEGRLDFLCAVEEAQKGRVDLHRRTGGRDVLRSLKDDQLVEGCVVELRELSGARGEDLGYFFRGRFGRGLGIEGEFR